jgi:hypothetical protein
MGNPLRVLRLHRFWWKNRFWWRLHRLNVGDYTVFHYEKSLNNLRVSRLHSFGGDYTG